MNQKRFDRAIQVAGGIVILAILAFLVTEGDLAGEEIKPFVWAILAAAGIAVGRQMPHNRE